MAILNNILKGQLKGRIGNTWFAHAKNSKGRPVTRAGSINETPTNPKTFKQMEQRAKFANAVKFYTRATQNFFKFAYEDKKANESDYNAFMRHNIDRSYVLPKSSVDAALFPALGNRWQLSQGSLNTPSGVGMTWNNADGTEIDFDWGGDNIGDISTFLINNSICKVDDIITIVIIKSYVTKENASTLDDVETPPLWNILQFVVNPKDKTPIEKIAGIKTFEPDISTSDGGRFVITVADPLYSVWYSVILTRKTSSGLKASTSFLQSNVPAAQLEALFIGQEAVNNAAASWGAQNSAILKGGIATRTDTSDEQPDAGKMVIATVQNQEPPYTINNSLNNNMSIRVTGSNLPQVAPVSSAPDIVSVQDFELNTARTQADFSIVKGTKFGNFSISYGGTTIIAGHTADGTDA